MPDRARYERMLAFWEAMSDEQRARMDVRVSWGLWWVNLIALVICSLVTAVGWLHGMLWPGLVLLCFSGGVADAVALNLFWRTGRPIFNLLRRTFGIGCIGIATFYQWHHEPTLRPWLFVCYGAAGGAGMALASCFFPAQPPRSVARAWMQDFLARKTAS